MDLTRAAPPATGLAYRVRTLGRVRGQPWHWTPGTWFDDVMLTVVLGGRGVYRRAGREGHVTAGMVGLVLPGGDVGLLMADPGEPYDHLYCRFTGQEAVAAARRLAGDYCSGWPFFGCGRWAAVAEVLLRGVAWGPVPEPTTPERAARVDAVLAEALAVLAEPTAGSTERRLTAAALRAYLLDHVAEPAALQPVADHFELSKAHLCRVARRLLGTTVQAAWEDAKIDRAQLLLRDAGLGVADVARRVGYADPFYFSKVFRARCGTSPSAWRAALH